MTELYELIKGLQPEEFQIIRNSFRKSNASKENVKNEGDSFLMAELFDLVSKKSTTRDDQAISEYIYGKEKIPALTKLKSRLFQHILDVLISDSLLLKENLYDPLDRNVIRLRKKMVQFRALYRKRHRASISVIYHLLAEIIREAKDYEQYDVLIDALYYKKYLLMLRKGVEEVKLIEKQIEQCEFAYKALLKTNDYYFKLITHQDMIQTLPVKEVEEMLREAINEIEGYCNEVDSATMRYACHILKLDQLMRAGKYVDALTICNELLDMVKKHSHICREERKAFIYDNISLCQVYNGDTEDALINVHRAQKLYSTSSISFLFSKQQEFYANFYAGNYQQAYEVITEMLSFPLMNTGEFRHDKFFFLQACTLFQLKDYKQSLKICNKTMKITQDKGRWGLGIRYIRLMCTIEVEDYDGAYTAVDSLRKLIERSNPKDVISDRDVLIYKAFNEYAQQDFSGNGPNLSKILLQLAETKKPHSWNYYTHELVPVHEWIMSKTGHKANG
jgi:hypothetical protein